MSAAGLGILNLVGCDARDDALTALAHSKWLPHLSTLLVSHDGASDAAQRALLEAWGDRDGLALEPQS